MKFAICKRDLSDWKIEDVFVHAASWVMPKVEIAPFTLANSVNEIHRRTATHPRSSCAP